MSLKSQVAGGLKWQVVMVVGRQGISLVIFTILARLLGPADFGLMGLTFIYLTIAGFLADQGIGTAIVQRSNLHSDHLHSAFWFNLGCGIVLCILTVVLADPISALFGDPRLAALLRWTSISLVFVSSTAIHNALFSREMDFRRPALRTLVAQLAGGIVGVGMALSDYGVWALVGQQLTASSVGAIFLWITSSYRPAMRFSVPHLRELFRFSSPLLFNWLVDFTSSRLDQLVIGRFLGTQALGIYVVASRIPDLLKQTTLQAISDVSMPALSRLQHDHLQMRDAIYQGMAINAVVMFAVFGGLAGVAPELVPLLFGSKWTGASTLCSLLCVYALVRALQVFTYPALLAAGITLQYLILNIANLVCSFVACMIGIRFGVAQLILALIFTSILMIVPSLFLLHKRIGLNPLAYWKPCIAPAIATALMLITIKVIAFVLPPNVHGWARLTSLVMVGAAVYLGFLQLFYRARLQQIWEIVANSVLGSRAPDAVPTQ